MKPNQQLGSKKPFVADIDPFYVDQVYSNVTALPIEGLDQQKMKLLETFHFWKRKKNKSILLT